MRELVRCDGASIRSVEAFLSAASGEPVELGELWLAAGPIGRIVAGAASASGVTLGRVVFLSGPAARRLGPDSSGGTLAPGQALGRLGPLFVHEAVHVWQFRREGAARFLLRYVTHFVTRYVRTEGRGPSRWAAAYEAIPYEREAFGLEARWLRRESD